jgi:hypothetical protein
MASDTIPKECLSKAVARHKESGVPVSGTLFLEEEISDPANRQKYCQPGVNLESWATWADIAKTFQF